MNINRQLALLVEKVSFQIMGVLFIFSLFKVNFLTVSVSIFLILLSEIIWHTHPKTRNEESISTFLAGVIVIYLTSLIQPSTSTLIFKGLGVLLLLLGMIRNVWKVSGHVAGFSFLFTISAIAGNILLSLFTLSVLPLVGWSRLALKRHDFKQVIAGFFLGILVPFLII